mmetsp:Transcript_20634/g.19970  ORF Transcript_20634/g.19970 Transcript_20634/m.19970 type:complete len:270 (+) Transcript_20634:2237-3046(+)|eukprot:CAMPEP_0119046574 /NCGR_PEP_ID=MMETSP1177-20130426/47574_1 /TAXON_ID=2985 /ORGANISM="Ochromonas sp, Strain CCMP1899" /LENGTH=269 /DNA_ID=CAMNT_0007019917 /DNA_START=2164 /DNA_END=2973 /DNA_ORIENTATION=-
MEVSPLSEPGFGWVSKGVDKVVLEDGGRVVSQDDMNAGFPTEFPKNFVQLYCDKNGIDFYYSDKDFATVINEILDSFHSIEMYNPNTSSLNTLSSDYNEFRLTGKSNGREMKWDIMTIQRNTSFRLHAHPNLELIYVIKGVIYEYRYEGSILKDFSLSTDTFGPDLSQGVSGVFKQRSSSAISHERDNTIPEEISAGSLTQNHENKIRNDHEGFLVNEKGSVHLSFTKEEEACLLVLWSGSHANIRKEHYPPPGVLLELPEDVVPLHND